MKKNNRGFVLISLLTTLPVILAMALATFSIIDILKKDLELKYVCRTELLSAQKENEKSILNLLKLNRRSTSLSQKKIRTQKALALAVLRADPIAIAASKARLGLIHGQQVALAAEQKAIILMANQRISVRQKNLETKIRNILGDKSEASMVYRLISLKSSKTSLAVRPTHSDIAPNFERVPNFSYVQSMDLKWQYDQNPGRSFSSFLKYSGSNEHSCSVTLVKSRDKWIAKIHRGKFL